LISIGIQRDAIASLANLFNGRVVDVGLDSIILELCAKPTRIDAFVELLRPYGIIESTRSGSMAMHRIPIDGVSSEEIEEENESVDASMLPPG
jgi:acetolactate synthase-1/3 small subunit